MLSKLVALAALVAAFLVAPAAAAGAEEEPYPPRVPTQTRIDVIVDGPGKPIRIRVSADANDARRPTGRIDIRVDKEGNGNARAARSLAARPVWQTSVRFEGDPVTITGPRLPRGSYVAHARFTPDDEDFFTGSENVTRFRVAPGNAGEVGGVDAESGGSVGGGSAGGGSGAVGGDSSGLPNTGGPDLLWLLLGGGLVAAGAGSVAYSRRRQPTLA